jgi:hypothetical protein
LFWVQRAEPDGRSSDSALAKGYSVVALVRLKASADLPEANRIEGDARDEGTLTRSLVVKGAESSRLMHDPEADRPCSALILVSYKSRRIAERFKPFKPQEKIAF